MEDRKVYKLKYGWQRLKTVKRLWGEGADGRNLEDTASGQNGYQLHKEQFGGNEVRRSPEWVPGFLGLRNWVNSIAICKNRESKENSKFWEKENIFSTPTSGPHLFYEARSPILWVLLSPFYAQRGKIFCPISHAAVWEAYYTPGFRAGKQGRPGPCCHRTYSLVGARRTEGKQANNKPTLKDCDGAGVEGRGPLPKVVSFVTLRSRFSWPFIEDKEAVTKFTTEEHAWQRENSNWEVPGVGTRLVCHWGIPNPRASGNERKSQFQGHSWEGEHVRLVAP